MVTAKTVLELAIRLVDEECAYLHEERDAYETFLEEVRLSTPDSTGATRPSETTEKLLTAYRKEVMETLDYPNVYGDTLAESLEEELSPTLAEVLLSKEPLTQRRKRDLLVKIATAIERREEFCTELNEERAALKTYTEEISDIEETLKTLPACSPQDQSLEKLLVVREVYLANLEQCEQLLEQRQQQIQEAERSLRIMGEKHARNEFLYSEMQTRYPVLSAIAAVCDRIDSSLNGKASTTSRDQSLRF